MTSLYNKFYLVPLACLIFVTNSLLAQLEVPKIFGDNMVIQRDQAIHVWGKGKPGSKVQVTLGTQSNSTQVDGNGDWSLELEALPASNQAVDFEVKSGTETIAYKGVVVGDVWLLGGQSNMEDVLESIYHGDTEVASANFPNIRLMTVPSKASPKPQLDIQRINEYNSWTRRHELKGHWIPCSPKTVSRFSAIGYVFGRRLHLVSQIPIGLIDASVGGTTAEAWTSRAKLKSIPASKGLLADWDKKIGDYDAKASLNQRIKNWERDSERRKKRGEKPRPKPTEPAPDPAFDRNNPGASYNAMIHPISKFNIRGAIFNQGYNNALGNARPKLYSKTFKAMIEDWRASFRNPKLPFGILGLTAGGQAQTLENFELRMVDAAPFIREAQHQAAKSLDGVCFMPSYDQQVPWYHPHKKFELGERIARWALNTVYQQKHLGWKPVELVEHKIEGDHIILTFDRAVRIHDGRPFQGFAIAGVDQAFVPAQAQFVIIGKDRHNRPRYDEKRVKVWNTLVLKPKAVRYAWARNPLGNVVNSQHHERIIPIPSFRTDNWDWPEAPFESADNESRNQHRFAIHQLRQKAKETNQKRRVQELKKALESISTQ